MTTKPRLDQTSDAVTPPVAPSTNSKEQVAPKATIGPVLSIRAFLFEGLSILDLLIPDLRQTNRAGHRLLGPTAFLQARRCQ